MSKRFEIVNKMDEVKKDVANDQSTKRFEVVSKSDLAEVAEQNKQQFENISGINDIKNVKNFSAVAAINKMNNGEYVSPEKIDSAVKTLSANSKGWAAKKNPTYYDVNGEVISENLQNAKNYYSLFDDEEDYSKNKKTVDWQIKYSQMNVDELKKAVGNLNGEDNAEEREFLENYIVAMQYEANRNNADFKRVIVDKLGVQYSNATKYSPDIPSEIIKNAKATKTNNTASINTASKIDISKYDDVKQYAKAYVSDASVFLNLTGHAVTDYMYQGNLNSGYKNSDNVDNRLEHISNSEAEMLIYISETQGKDAAWKYINSLADTIGQRKLAASVESFNTVWEGSTWYEKAGLNLLSHAYQVFEGPVAVADMVNQYIKKGAYDPYTEYQVDFASRQLIRSNTESDLTELVGDWGQVGNTNFKISDTVKGIIGIAYQGTMSAGDMLLGAFLFGGGLYGASMGAYSAASEARDLYERGVPQWKIATVSGLFGVVEYITEKIGADRFLKNIGSGVKKDLWKSMAAESLEEVAAANIDRGIDLLFNGLNSKDALAIQQMMEEDGYTLSQAVTKRLWDNVSEDGRAALSAAFSVFVGSGAPVAVRSRAMTRVGAQVVNNGNASKLIDCALTLPEDTEAYKMAVKLSSAKKASNESIGQLYVYMTEYLQTAAEDKMTATVAEQLRKSGVDGSLAETIIAMAKMEDIDNDQIKAVLDNPAAKSVYTALINPMISDASAVNTRGVMGELASEAQPAWAAKLRHDISGMYFAKQEVSMMARAKANDMAAEHFEDLISNKVVDEVYSNTVRLPDNMSLRKQGVMGETSASVSNPGLQSGENETVAGENSGLQSTANGEETVSGTQTVESEAADTVQNSGVQEGLSEAEADKVALNPKNPNRRHVNAKTQNYMKEVGKDLGVTVVYEDIEKELAKQGIELDGKIPDGYIDDDGVIHLSYYSVNPTRIVFKHELVHYGKRYNPEGYATYTAAIDKTQMFKEWLQENTKSKSESIGELKELYRERIEKERGNLAPKETSKLNEEMYADFSGMLFENSEFERLIKQVDSKKRPAVIQYVLDFLSYLKDKLSRKKGITLEIKHLETAYANMLKEAKNNPTEQSGGMDFAINYPSFSSDEIKENSLKLQTMSAVKHLTGKEFPKSDIPLQKRILDFFDSIGNNVYSELFGDVALNNSSVRDDLGHGKTNNKITAFAAVPDVIKKGVVIDMQRRGNGNYDRIVVAAPIKIDKTDFAMGVMLQRDHQSQRLVLHDVVVINKEETSSKTETAPSTTEVSENNDSLYMTNILQKALSVKIDSMPNPENYSEDNKNGKTFSIPMIAEQNTDRETDTDQDKRDIVSEAEILNEKYNNGEISREEYREGLDSMWVDAVNRFGTIPEGEKAQAPIAVPKKVAENKPTERFVRTIIETGKLTDDMLEDVSADILLGNFAYEVVSDEKAQKIAERSIENDTAERIWNEAVGKGVISKNDIAIGEKLLLEAIEKDDRLRVLELSSELADVFTRAGQTVQAARMLKKMSGIGRLMTVQQNIRTINKDLTEKYGTKAKTVKLNSRLGTRLAKAETGEDIEIVYQDILQDVASQVPATFLDKLNAWRYFAMLANPRTHIRNLVGNTVFTVPIVLKNVISTATERVFIRDTDNRTKSVFIQKEYKDFAAKDIKSKEAQAMLKGTGQLDTKGQIMDMQKTFETKWLEKLTKSNSNLLEAEDMLFKTIHYKMALAGYLQAQKVDLNNISPATLSKAREYAVKEAKKATFQDASFIAEKLNTMFRIPSTSKWSGNKGAEAASLAGRFMVEGVLPFKRTPINIVKRGVEYSPIGLATTIVSGIADVKSGRFSASEFIDGLSSVLTGTGIMLAGMLLASLGLAKGGFGDDKEDKFKRLNGEQEYSLQIGGKSYSIDWMAPSAIPFFVGVELSSELDKDGEMALSDIPDAFWNALEPLTNLSMLSGIQRLIDAVRYEEENKTISAMAGDAALSFAMQFIPSTFGAAARTVDPTQRTWYNDKNSKWLDSFSQNIVNNVKSRVPGLSYTQAPDIDAWGREKNRGGVGERMLENFISPGYYSSVDYDSTDNELKRIYKETGENVFPETAEKYFEVNGKTKYLTADEWVTYAKEKGELSYDYIHEFTESKAYKKLTDGERAKVITNLYKLANAKAKTTVSDYDLMKQFKKVINYEKNGGSAVTYYIHLALSD